MNDLINGWLLLLQYAMDGKLDESYCPYLKDRSRPLQRSSGSSGKMPGSINLCLCAYLARQNVYDNIGWKAKYGYVLL